MHIRYWWESQKVGDHWEDLDVGGWTILKWILEREDVSRSSAARTSSMVTIGI
jgi:hypothetical protein